MSSLVSADTSEDDTYSESVEDVLLYEQSPNNQNTAVDDLIIQERKLKIHKAISLLPESIRYCIDSYYIYGNKVKEIAEELDLPVNTIKSRLRIGRERLAYLLQEENTND